MLSRKMPIAVFDSGLGGISVLKELIRLMPQENYIYYGDSKNAPYGPRTPAEVCDLTLTNIDFLLEKSAKVLVLACNTATSVTVAILREKYSDIPIIGIEPALKPAIMTKIHGRILVMATEMTLREKKFSLLLNKYKDSAEIIKLPAPGIVELVEKGITDGPELDLYLQELLAPYRQNKVDAIVLGCTHFPFVKENIKKGLGYDVAIYDGSFGTAMQTKRQVIAKGLKNPDHQPGKIEFYNSRGDQEILDLCEKLLKA
jgi:glutamate racemase